MDNLKNGNVDNTRKQMTCNSFIFYRSFFESIRELSLEQQAEIYDAIFRYEFDGETVELKGVNKAVFTLIKPQLEANRARYINGMKGGRPPKTVEESDSADNQSITEEEPNYLPTITESKPNDNLDITKEEPNGNQSETKAKPNVNDNVNDNYNIAANAANKANQALRNIAEARGRKSEVLKDPEKTAWLTETFENFANSIQIMYVAEIGAYGNTRYSDRLSAILKRILKTESDGKIIDAIRKMSTRTFCEILCRMNEKQISDIDSYVKKIAVDECYN